MGIREKKKYVFWRINKSFRGTCERKNKSSQKENKKTMWDIYSDNNDSDRKFL